MEAQVTAHEIKSSFDDLEGLLAGLTSSLDPQTTEAELVAEMTNTVYEAVRKSNQLYDRLYPKLTEGWDECEGCHELMPESTIIENVCYTCQCDKIEKAEARGNYGDI